MSLFGPSPSLVALYEFAFGRARELRVGFQTDRAFSLSVFKEIEAKRGAFTLTGPLTGTVYMFTVKPGTVTNKSVRVILIGWSGNLNSQADWLKFTLVRMTNGAIEARAGWGF